MNEFGFPSNTTSEEKALAKKYIAYQFKIASSEATIQDYEFQIEYYDTDRTTCVKSIFLAGPTPRTDEEKKLHGWRKDLAQRFKKAGYAGTVFVPEFSNDKRDGFEKYSDFPEWELERIDSCDVLIFWVPRLEDCMSGFTTNVEFGYAMSKYPEKVVYGRPPDSYKNRYLDYLYKKQTGLRPVDDLDDLVTKVMEKIEK